MRVLTTFVITTLALVASASANEPASPDVPALKLSGYIQARYTAEQDASRFGVRRGRLKATHATEWSRAVLQLDATPSGVSLKDAEATFIEPWTGRKTSLTLGQTKLPFGFEAPQSSSVRAFPERSQVIRAFVPGERDRGLKFNAKLGFLLIDAGVFNGNGVSTASDNDRAKDVVGRIGVDFDGLSGGLSGWWGKTVGADGISSPRDRAGVDLRLYHAFFDFGDTALGLEWIVGHTWVRNGVEHAGAFASGGYAALSQGIADATHVAFRYDRFASADDAVDTFALAVTHDFNDFLELTVAAEKPVAASPLFTLQLQAKL